MSHRNFIRTLNIVSVSVTMGLSLALIGCAGSPDTEPAPLEPTETTEQTETNMTEKTINFIGTWESDERGTPRLEFTSDGTVRGTDGCNRISTQFESGTDGVSAKLESFASTLKACQGVDTWLRSVREVRIEGDVMRILNSQGEEIGQLQRQSAESGT